MTQSRDNAGVGFIELGPSAPPDWVQRIAEHYAATGTVRSEDARLILGDQSKGIELCGDPQQGPGNRK
jgi:hypothetical protein